MEPLTKEELSRERMYVLILAAIQVSHILDFVIMMPLGTKFMSEFNITPTQFSGLVSSYTISAGSVGLFGALYADHFDKKKYLLVSFVGFILGTFMCALATNFGTLLTARIIAGAFGGVLNASVFAIVTELIPFQRRGTAMGVVMSAFSISSIAGVPTGLWIANTYSWQAAFYFICALASLFWFASLIILPPVRPRAAPRKFKDNLRHFRNIFRQWDYLQSFLFTSFLAFGVFMVVPFIAPYMVKNVGMLESQLPYIYLVGGIFTVVTARIVGKLSDRLGSFRVFRVMAFVSIVPMLVMTNLPPSALWVALAVTTCFTMFGSARFIPAMTMVSAVANPHERGTFMSLENSIRHFACGLASQVAGIIIGSTAAGSLSNYNVVGGLSALATLIAIGIAFQINRKISARTP